MTSNYVRVRDGIRTGDSSDSLQKTQQHRSGPPITYSVSKLSRRPAERALSGILSRLEYSELER